MLTSLLHALCVEVYFFGTFKWDIYNTIYISRHCLIKISIFKIIIIIITTSTTTIIINSYDRFNFFFNNPDY